jgi:hypothetical protein
MKRRLYRGRLPRTCLHAGACSTDSTLCGELGVCSATAWLVGVGALDPYPTSSGVPA